ncbi:porin [Pseudooceanicola sp.]|uniref:porin n=1 Tax=Pseudooceanicola sp. TaxID=1914328 RepID=UPI00261CDF24|nr:porin [Pseudooceanicola sp.]MDF1855290.1 porin [Pseudooceanicola sp.]
MTKSIHLAGMTCALVLASTAAKAESSTGFTWEGALELGIDSTVSSDIPGAELSDIYGSAELTFGFAFNESLRAFAGISVESVLDPTGNRLFGDIGAYVGELGLAFSLGSTEIATGKISPAFGIAWDQAPGFYGSAYAEDYELSEMIGISATTELGRGTLSAAVFFADTTVLSDSLGTSRGRLTRASGGAGNTGKLNNVALQYDVSLGATSLSASGRFMSAGVGDVSNETGLALGLSHAINDRITVIGEIARFEGFGGSADDATYVTLGASLASGPITYNASFTHRSITSTGTDRLLSLGVDYEFRGGQSLSAGVGFANEAGQKSTMLGLALVIPFGG